MSAENQISVPGIVKGGVVVPQSDSMLPDGAHVEIVVGRVEIASELQAELRQWDQAADEAWDMIDEWEKEDE